MMGRIGVLYEKIGSERPGQQIGARAILGKVNVLRKDAEPWFGEEKALKGQRNVGVWKGIGRKRYLGGSLQRRNMEKRQELRWQRGTGQGQKQSGSPTPPNNLLA